MLAKQELKDLSDLGYTVTELAAPLEGTVYVEGYGVAIYVPASDTGVLIDLADPNAHKERVKQHREGNKHK